MGDVARRVTSHIQGVVMIRLDLSSFSASALLRSIVLALLFGLLVWASITLTSGSGRIVALWIPNAVLLAALMGMRDGWHWRHTLPCFIANITANMLAGDGAFVAVGIASANLLEVTLIFLLLRRWQGSKTNLATTEDLRHFVVAAGLIGPIVSGLVATAVLAFESGNFNPAIWLQWAASDSLGLLILTPPLFIAYNGWRRAFSYPQRFYWEFLAIMGCGTLLTLTVFTQVHFGLLFPITPFVILAAFRAELLGTSLSVLIIAVISSIATSYQIGPIWQAGVSDADRLLILQLFLLTNFAMAMPVALTLAARDKLRAEYAQARINMASVLDSINNIAFRTDINGNFVYLNKAWENHMLVSIEKTIGRSMASFAVPTEKRAVIQKLADLTDETESGRTSELRFLRHDGSERIMEARLWAVRSDKGIYEGAAGTMRDVTEQSRAETELMRTRSELIQVSRLSAMGAMASTIAHELNQPLAAVANFSRGLRNRLEASGTATPETIEVLHDIDDGVVRASQIVKRLRSLVERGYVERSHELLPPLIREARAIGLLDAESKGITCEERFDPYAPSVLVDKIQIQQVLVNLLRNAAEVLDGRSQRYIFITTKRMEDMVEVIVEDSGPGIAEDMAEDVFTAFKSSKPDGMGVGLSISRTIIEAHGGQIILFPSTLGGAGFKMTLPAVANMQLVK